MIKLILMGFTLSYLPAVAQNPIEKITRSIESDWSSGSNQLGAFKVLLEEIIADGRITPDDFYLVAKWQKRIYDGAEEDLNVKQTLTPKIQALTWVLEEELLKRYEELNSLGKGEIINQELHAFNEKLRSVAGDEYGIKLSPDQLDEFIQQLDHVVERMDLPGIVDMVKGFSEQ